MFAHSKKVYATLAVYAIVLFARVWTPSKNGYSWLPAVGWIGCMVCVLTLILFSLALAVRGLARRRTATAR